MNTILFNCLLSYCLGLALHFVFLEAPQKSLTYVEFTSKLLKFTLGLDLQKIAYSLQPVMLYLMTFSSSPLQLYILNPVIHLWPTAHQ